MTQAPRHIAVLDIGKTNAKLALVDAASLDEIAVVTRPNRVLPGPPWPHFDLEGHWRFFLEHLAGFHAAHGIDAIAITTHGASVVLLDGAGALAAPMLDYEHPGPDTLAAEYDRLRPDFALTGSARLPVGLNVGAQLHWMFAADPGLAQRSRHVLTYPQYWLHRLTGELACDVTSLGCHTDLWLPSEGRPSALATTLGIDGKLAPALAPGQMFQGLRPEVVTATGLPPETPVTCGIHDSNASLYPYVRGRPGPFAVVSTGTWVVSMAIGGTAPELDPARDTLVNVNALGDPVPSARFMGGREFEVIRQQGESTPDADDRAALLAENGPMLLPSVEPGSGPFRGRQMRWTLPPATDGQRSLALSWYLALMTRTCLDLIGAQGPVIVEGPFGRNPDYLAMLASLGPDGVETAASATGTSAGAAMLCLPEVTAPTTKPTPQPEDAAALRLYAARWQALVQG